MGRDADAVPTAGKALRPAAMPDAAGFPCPCGRLCWWGSEPAKAGAAALRWLPSFPEPVAMPHRCTIRSVASRGRTRTFGACLHRPRRRAPRRDRLRRPPGSKTSLLACRDGSASPHVATSRTRQAPWCGHLQWGSSMRSFDHPFDESLRHASAIALRHVRRAIFLLRDSRAVAAIARPAMAIRTMPTAQKTRAASLIRVKRKVSLQSRSLRSLFGEWIAGAKARRNRYGTANGRMRRMNAVRGGQRIIRQSRPMRWRSGE